MEPTQAPWAVASGPEAGGGGPPLTAAPWATGGASAAGTPRPLRPPPSALRPGTPMVAFGGRGGATGATSEPEPEAAPAALGPGGYRAPTKAITNPMHVAAFCQSETYHQTLQFAKDLQAAAKGRPLRGDVAMSPICSASVAMLVTMEAWVDEIPPQQQAMRFGNAAFKDWHARVVLELPALLAEVAEKTTQRPPAATARPPPTPLTAFSRVLAGALVHWQPQPAGRGAGARAVPQ